MLNKRIASRYLQPLEPIPTSLVKSGKPLTGIQCVLFDIYGTLLISASGGISPAGDSSRHHDHLAYLIKKFNLQSTPPALVDALREAIASAHHAQREKGVLFPEVEIDRIWMQVLDNPRRKFVRKFALEYELSVNPVYPMPGLEALLRTCRTRRLQMGLISNAQFYTVYLLKWLLGAAPENFGFHADLIFLSYRMGCAKPSLELFSAAAAALEKLNIPREATLFMGNDMRNDILPAQQLGFRTALFAGDKRSLRLRQDDPCCRNLSADIVLTELNQLFDFIY